MLIVCEGEKTEPQYFEGLRVAYRLSSANIAVAPMGRDPLSLINYAIAELENDPNLTRAYCVFDRDGHATFGDAVNKAHQCTLGQCGRLRLAVSIPCFEVWPLLHFGFSTAPIVGGGGKSPGEQALAELQNAMPATPRVTARYLKSLSPDWRTAFEMPRGLRRITKNQARIIQLPMCMDWSSTL